MQTRTTLTKETQLMSRARMQNRIKLFAVALPLVSLVVAFSYVPIFGWYYAFVDYIPGAPFYKQVFVGFQQFQLLFQYSGDVLNVVRNTFALSSLILVTTPIPAIFAIALSQLKSHKFTKLVQTVSSLPYFISFILVYAVFFSVFSSEDGVLNIILTSYFNFKEPVNILIDDNLAWIVQTAVHLFKTTGYSGIIYIAAISGIDQELYNAAEVDGAGLFQKIWHITVPGISSTFFVLFLLTVAGMFSGSGFEQYFVFQNPFILDKIDVIDTYSYNLAFGSNSNYSLATAVGALKSVLSIGVLFAANTISKMVRGESII